jgi:5-methylcytosine-specific restriction protein A
MNLTHLTDKQLHIDTKNLASYERKITAQLLHHFREIETRKLFSEYGYRSLFAYAVQELGFSEGAAVRRINASRLLKQLPELEKKIEDGELTLSNLSKVSDKFKQENITNKEFQKEIIATIENASSKQCDKVLSEIITPNTIPTEPVKYFHPLNLSLSEETYKKYEEVRGLLAHRRLNKDEMFYKIFEVTAEQIKKEKFKTTSTQIPASSDTRHIPAGLRRAVYERDKCCQKCGSNYALEVNHIIPYALGGKTELSNLNLLCFNCNQRARISSNLHWP